MAQRREAEARNAADKAKRDQNVRDAERQRDASKAKAEQLQRLQNSVDWWDKHVTNARVEGRDARWLAEQRDNARNQKQEFERR
jgi:CRISPR/Cas system-associated endoribonuclease Cas2